MAAIIDHRINDSPGLRQSQRRALAAAAVSALSVALEERAEGDEEDLVALVDLAFVALIASGDLTTDGEIH